MFNLPKSATIWIAIGSSISVAILLKVLRSAGWLGRKAKQWVQVGYLTELWIYPVKGFKGKSINRGWCSVLGVVNEEEIDRQFMLVRADDHSYVSIKHEPQIVLVESSVENDMLILVTPEDRICVDLEFARDNNNKIEIRISADATIHRKLDLIKASRPHFRLWKTQGLEGFDCGDLVANWISKFLGKPPGTFRLLYHDPCSKVLKNERELRTYHQRPPGPMNHRRDLTLFSNVTNYTLLCDQSIADLNERIDPERPKFYSQSFRPNFLVETTRPAFDEDNWSHVKIGDTVELAFMKPTHRCPVTTVNMEKGEMGTDGEPLKTLRKYRQGTPEQQKLYKHSPMISVNLALDVEGEIRVGDPVYAVIS